MGSIGGYVPKTELGRKLLALRNKYESEGGKFLNREELDAEIASRRMGQWYEQPEDSQELPRLFGDNETKSSALWKQALWFALMYAALAGAVVLVAMLAGCTGASAQNVERLGRDSK